MGLIPNRRYLLDTHVAIWLDRNPKRVSTDILALLDHATVELWVSAVSFWEVAIKQAVGKMERSLRLEPVLATYAMQELPIVAKYTEVVRELPLLHGDPFDRMLVAQAKVEGMVLVTGDGRLAAYGVPVLLV